MIGTLEFKEGLLNPRMMNGDLGAAFADFAFEVLEGELPGLVRFPSGGKDGAIDLSATDGTRTVVECKHVGGDDMDRVAARWREVADRLRRNLADPAGPPKGQAQYGPWYRTDPAIDTYLFCVSRHLPNLEARDKLALQIRNDFARIAGERPHLAHLRAVSVRVVDFGELLDMAGRRAHAVYRWFPSTRPFGLLPLEEPLPAAGFRAYLSGARLPHYSLHHHRARASVPEQLAIHDEQELLAVLDRGDATGLLITGAGGFGKTRLTAEIGELAHQQEWTVLRALSSIDRASIEQLGETVRPGERTLLLFDYVEVQRGFQDLVGLLNDLNDQYDFALRWVANCRRSYSNRLAAVPRHVRFNLSPLEVEAHAPWYRDYQRAVVDHILRHSGLEVTDAHLRVCRQTPVLAVFLSYLHEGGRDLELGELLNEQDFAAWVLKRVQLSTGGPVETALAQLMTLLPFAVDAPLDDDQRALVERLAADGWIEETPTDSGERTLWATAHDVLADQIVVSHLDRVALTAAQFVDATLARAEEASHLPSALASLQRVADVPALASLDWQAVLDARIAAAPAAWRDVRSWLLETSLLTPEQQLAMLERHASLWDGDERLLDFQKQMGRLVRWALEQEARTGAPIARRATLEARVAAAAAAATEANDIVTNALRLAPEQARETALRWLRGHPHEYDSHYLLVAWLRQGLPIEDVADYVQTWIAQHPTKLGCGYLLRAWLDAGGEREAVREAMVAWLAVNSDRLDASSAYCAWLFNGGERELIDAPLSRWLERNALASQFAFVCGALLRTGDDPATLAPSMSRWIERHGESAGARVLFEAWFEFGPDLELVRAPFARWLELHGSDVEAGITYGAWLRASGDRELVEEPLERWLELHALADQFSFVCTGLLHAGTDVDALRPRMTAWLAVNAERPSARHVLESWLDGGCDPRAIRVHLEQWLELYGTAETANYLYRSWLDAHGGCEAVAAPLRLWLAEHAEHPEADFVYRGWLDAGGDRAMVQEAMLRWLDLYAAVLETSFLYRSWLDAGGGWEVVAEAVRRWLAEHAERPEADWVYRGWLDAGGDHAMVEEPMLRWLACHGLRDDADYVYRAWLRAEGDLAVVRAMLLDWLAQHGETLSASYVYSSWLQSGGGTPAVQTSLLAWLEQHGEARAAGFVLRSWLDCGGETATVRAAVLHWLECNRHDRGGSVVCCAWLNAGGDPECLRAFVEEWLAHHGEQPNATFVLVAWLKTDADSAVVLERAYAWMGLHRESPDAGHLVSELARRHESMPPETVEAVLTWCLANPSHRRAVWGLSQLGRALQEPETADQVLRAAEAVLGELDGQPDVSVGVANLVPQLLQRLIGHPQMREGEARERVDALVVAWLRHEAAYPAGRGAARFVQHAVYFQRFVDLVCSGAIDYAGADRAAVERFLRWVDGWMPERKRTFAPAVRFLGHTQPAPELWALVTQS